MIAQILFVGFIVEAARAKFLLQRPVLYVHGLLAECNDLGLDPVDLTTAKLSSSEKIKICIETGAGSSSLFYRLESQAKRGCTMIKKMIFTDNGSIRPLFKYGFHLYGYSQGGLIVRFIYKDCADIRDYIASLTLDGSPLMGVDRFPDLKNFNVKSDALATVGNFFLNLVKKWVKYYENTRRKWTVLQYLNGNTKTASVINELNNDQIVSFDTLPRLNLISYDNEYIVNPISSSTFGVDIDPSDPKKWLPFETQQDYADLHKKLGLKSLFEDRRLVLVRSAGTHINPDWAERSEIDWLTDDDCNYDETIEELGDKVYRECLQEKLKTIRWVQLRAQVYYNGHGVTLPNEEKAWFSLEDMMAGEEEADFFEEEMEENSTPNMVKGSYYPNLKGMVGKKLRKKVLRNKDGDGYTKKAMMYIDPNKKEDNKVGDDGEDLLRGEREQILKNVPHRSKAKFLENLKFLNPDTLSNIASDPLDGPVPDTPVALV